MICVYCVGEIMQEGISNFSVNWAKVEVVVYILHCSMDTIKELLQKGAAPNNNNSNNATLYNTITSFLYNVANHILTDNAIKSCPITIFRESVGRFLGSLTFMVTSPKYATVAQDGSPLPFINLYFPILQVTFEWVAESNKRVAMTGARSFHQLCIHGTHIWPTAENNTQDETILNILFSLVTLTENYTKEANVYEVAMLNIIESLTRVIMRLPWLATQMELISKLSGSMIVQLELFVNTCTSLGTLARDVLSIKRLEILLSYCCQIIRFCDTATGSQAMGPFIVKLWPLLMNIYTICSSHTSPSNNNNMNTKSSVGMASSMECSQVASNIIDIYARIIMSFHTLGVEEMRCILYVIQNSIETRAYHSATALKCSATFAEYYAMQSDPYVKTTPMIGSLLLSISQRYVTLIQSNNTSSTQHMEYSLIFGSDSSIENFFQFCYNSLLFCGEQLLPTENQPIIENVFYLLRTSMEYCRERDALRVILQVIQYIFNPFRSHEALQHLLYQSALRYGANIIELLVQRLTNGSLPTSLVPNVANTLYSVAVSIYEEKYATYRSTWESWFHTVLFNPNNLVPFHTQEYRHIVLQAIVQNSRNKNNRKFIALIAEIHKICASEQTVDSIIGFAEF